MDRRTFVSRAAWIVLGGGAASGCRGRQTAQVLKPGDSQMVGSHTAGGETFKPLVDESVSRLLGRHASQPVMMVGYQGGPPAPTQRRVCFIGVENKSSEEIGDFKEQIYQMIDTRILESGQYQAISRRFVQAGLAEVRLRPDQLFVPDNMRMFSAVMERQGQPFDYLLYATITSGTTVSNKDYQRDYLLSLEMINIHTGQADKESATLSKGYNRSLAARVKNFSFKP